METFKTKSGSISLEWDEFYWLGSHDFPTQIELHVNCKDEEPCKPHKKQLQAWDDFESNYQELNNSLLNAILEYYCLMRPKYESMGSEWVENMPIIKSTEEIEKLITLNYITISWPYNESEVKLGLNYSCTWEQEHGLGVVIEKEKVIDIGGADCAII